MKSRRRCSGISQTSAAWLWPPPAIRTTTIFISCPPPEWAFRHQRRLNQVGRQGTADRRAQRPRLSSPHNLLKPEIVAPGELIQSAKMGTGSDGAWFTGSSLATPHVSGAAALARQAYPERTATHNQVAAPEHRESDRAQGRHPLSGVVGGSRFSRCGTGGQDHRHRYGRGHGWFNNPVAG